jgi:hypothetical protein
MFLVKRFCQTDSVVGDQSEFWITFGRKEIPSGFAMKRRLSQQFNFKELSTYRTV